MELPVERVVVLDDDFGPMAVEAGGHAMSVPGLALREKVMVWLAGDVCNGHLGVPYELHLSLGLQAGLSWQELREVLRHLAPYAGYPAVVQAFVRLREIADGADSAPASAGDPAGEPPAPPEVDGGFADWLRHQEETRWGRPLLTARERALLCVAVDVFYQTLGEPFRAHVEAARAAGVDAETLRNLLRLMGELGAGKVWQALEALATLESRG
ncbi:dehydrogenase [Nonomuraea sp. FMUSA5-5]|uniref:Dehydrogenase n=1 Tax=Nonomuraea composti TaxID=2720023 RepID=A0ABX1BAP3_9ACTN|nr:dehydrogenase [Nonomuraea sp. FMUSA5-5]